MTIRTSDGKIVTQEQLDKLVADANQASAQDEKESTVSETPNDDTIVAVEAPQNDATSPITASQPQGDELIATQVDDEPAQVAEVERPSSDA
jgi:hypothetical protein